jgi:hypothetical protein
MTEESHGERLATVEAWIKNKGEPCFDDTQKLKIWKAWLVGIYTGVGVVCGVLLKMIFPDK